MNYLLDTNQLLYSVNPAAPQHKATTEAIRRLVLAQDATFVTPQTLMEFWRSATRPTDAQPAGLGMTPEAAGAAIERFIGYFSFLPDTPGIFDEWRRIALIHQVRGAKVHDARLVAVMWTYGVDRILTNNVKDFQRYPRIRAITAEELPDLMRELCLLFLLLAALVAAGARPAQAALIRTYDLDSLCYRSSDIVEVTLNRQFPAGRPIAQDPLTATVIHSLAGSFHPGDQITSLNLDLYTPAASGQRCFLFLERTEYSPHWWPTPPAPLAAPRVVDMLVIDGQGYVRRYFQWNDPGGLRAVGYSPDPLWTMPKNGRATVQPPGFDTSDEAGYPTAAQERATIAAKWAAANALRPLLSRAPRPQDAGALLALLRARRKLRAPQGFLPTMYQLTDGLALAVCCRLADLHDPATALDAIVTDGNKEDEFLSGLYEAAGSDYARALLADPQAPTPRRIAAADVLAEQAQLSPSEAAASRAAVAAVALSPDTPEPLRLALLTSYAGGQPRFDLAAAADALRALYHSTASPELQFAIEKAFVMTPYDTNEPLYFALHPASGPVLSIVRPSADLPVKPGFVGLAFEFYRPGPTPRLPLTRDYLFTNRDTGKVYRTKPGPSDAGWGGLSDEQVPLPPGLTPGHYRVALEFRDKARLVSAGHAATLTLP